MRIDFVTECRPATDLEKIAMDMYGDYQRYEILTSDGKQYSIQWNFKSLDEFLPKKSVSEVLKDWQNNFIRLIAEYKDCIKYNQHPNWTTTQYYYTFERGRTFPVEHTFERPQQITKSQREYFQKEIEKLENIKEELKFVAINNFDFILNEPCSIHSNISMKDSRSNVQVVKEDEEYLYYVEVYDSHLHAPSQRLQREGKIRKAEVGLMQYYSVTKLSLNS